MTSTSSLDDPTPLPISDDEVRALDDFEPEVVSGMIRLVQLRTLESAIPDCYGDLSGREAS